MIYFPNAKINLGLSVLRKMEDGFHEIESLLYPVNLCDVLEIVPSDQKLSEFNFTGLKIASVREENLCYKAFALLSDHYKLPSIKLHLHKIIPMGAGLGGGSVDAAFTLKLISTVCGLNLNESELLHFAAKLGSDCPFFIRNVPSMVSGRGDVAIPANIHLSYYHIAVVCPGIHISTAWAYRSVKPEKTKKPLQEIILLPVDQWKDKLINDFEKVVFLRYPEISLIKKQLYDEGAVYASLSGSGSAVYGLFNRQPQLKILADKYFTWSGKMD